MPRDSASGLTPSGPTQALFKTLNRFVLKLELFRVMPLIIRASVLSFPATRVNGVRAVIISPAVIACRAGLSG
ncbi:hypothetical protein DA718_16705 [Klebsiella huaxiensis]|nr:hypothetical protein DA718_16705 [Klebsiella huaxiensis]